jgi:hypothetical protein
MATVRTNDCNTSSTVLCMAFELAEHNWKPGFTTGLGPNAYVIGLGFKPMRIAGGLWPCHNDSPEAAIVDTEIFAWAQGRATRIWKSPTY